MLYNFPQCFNYTDAVADPSLVDSDGQLVNRTVASLLCNDRGVCTMSGEYDGREDSSWTCQCELFWDADELCRKDFFTLWNGSDLFYPIIGILIYLPALFLATLETIIDARRFGLRSFFRKTFVAKVIVFAFTLFRILHFGLWLARSTNGIEAVAPLAEAIPYATGLALAIVGYAMVVISWTELVTAVKKMKADVKKSLNLFRRIVLIALAVSVPVLIILYIVQSIQPELNIVYNAFMGVFLLALACTQTYHGWTVRSNFNKMSNYKDVINGPQTRNSVLLAGTGVTFCLVIVLAYYPFGGFRYSASGFLAYQTIVRIGEWILCYIFILVIESYLTPFGWFRGYKLGLTLTGEKLEHIGAMTIAKTRTSRTSGSNQRSLAESADSYNNSSVAYGSSVAVSYTSAGNTSLTTSGSIAASVSG
eukprot:TRINITY_DN203_c1_g2_i1.p1 TRINITY_DN203_c1_g2~~TRINITY_DN203_c1_g2_i1.p1  ORF type:complete len:421 (-),score=71.72 TRINITY_DN203_c1_g2_i1:120-1382(-)